MYKIYFAINHKELENFIMKYKPLIEKNLNQEVEFVGRTVYREGVIPGIEEFTPDLIILRESLPGAVSISDLIYNIRVKSSKTRIVFIANDRQPGDPLLRSLVNMGVYDLLIGNKVDAKEMLKRIIYPNELSAVSNLIPKEQVDESTNKVSYETPTIASAPTPTPIVETKKEQSFENDFAKQSAPKPISLDPIQPVNVSEEKKPQKRGLFGKKKETATIKQQIVTFVGASEGVGNSQIAFNTAVNLANKGFNILYIDLNNRHAAMDTIFQLGYEDIGIDTALEATDTRDLEKISQCIGTIPKALSVISKKDYLYGSYVKLPTTLSFLFFSQLCMNGQINVRASYVKFRDLLKILLKDFHYDVIVLDAPANFRNPITQMAIAYAEKLFVTVTQDNSVIASFIKGTRVLDNKGIRFKDKMNVIINKFEKCDFTNRNVYSLISGNIDYEGFSMYCLPNLNREFISASFNAMPITLTCKNKDLQKTFADIQSVIEE